MSRSTAHSYSGTSPDIAEGYVAIGQIGRAFGIRGEVQVTLHTDSPQRLLERGQVFLGPEAKLVELASARSHKDAVVVRLDGCEDRNAAEALRGLWLQVPRSDLPELPEGENYVFDLVGLQVVTTEGEELGEITEVIFTGANEVFVVNGPRGEVLIPYINDVIASEDLEAGRIEVRPVPGLLD